MEANVCRGLAAATRAFLDRRHVRHRLGGHLCTICTTSRACQFAFRALRPLVGNAGELGTSHAYESGGEYRQRRHYHQGFLGVDWSYDAENDRYRIARIIRGDPSDNNATSPLTSPGLNINVGDAVLAINGQRVSLNRSPATITVN